MKELGEVTLMTEWVKAPSVGVVLPLTHLQNLVSFPRYGRLNEKCWYKQICNGTYWLLLTGHFGPVFVRPSQWSITAVTSYVHSQMSVYFLTLFSLQPDIEMMPITEVHQNEAYEGN